MISTTYYTKEKLKETYGFTGKRFYYTVEKSSPKRGYNRTIKVFFMTKKSGRPVCIGNAHVTTASYCGDSGTAVKNIAEIYGYKNDGYDFKRKDIQLHEIF